MAKRLLSIKPFNPFPPSASLYSLFSCFYAQEMLDRPVESLLMNQADHFRETQEERELLNQVMPLINTGYVRSQLAFLPCVCIRKFSPAGPCKNIKCLVCHRVTEWAASSGVSRSATAMISVALFPRSPRANRGSRKLSHASPCQNASGRRQVCLALRRHQLPLHVGCSSTQHSLLQRRQSHGEPASCHQILGPEHLPAVETTRAAGSFEGQRRQEAGEWRTYTS